MEVEVSRGEQPPLAPLAAPSLVSMGLSEIHTKTVLRKSRGFDPWFVAGCGMNLYRGCGHDCAYCDGRAEKYRVEGAFGSDVQVKVNAIEVLGRELGSAEQGELWPESQAWHGGFVLLGGGVGDSYQPAETRYGLARGALELFARRGIPVHVLTKSNLVLRDADLLARIAGAAGALVSFSLSSADDAMSAHFEPGAPAPSERLRALEALRKRGINGGIFLMPVIPFLTDGEEALERTVAAAADAGAQYVLFGGMTLKQGRQKDHFLATLARVRPDLVARVDALYPGPAPGRTDYGNPHGQYAAAVARTFARAAHRHAMPIRIPLALCARALDARERERVRADHARAEREMGRYLR